MYSHSFSVGLKRNQGIAVGGVGVGIVVRSLMFRGFNRFSIDGFRLEAVPLQELRDIAPGKQPMPFSEPHETDPPGGTHFPKDPGA